MNVIINFTETFSSLPEMRRKMQHIVDEDLKLYSYVLYHNKNNYKIVFHISETPDLNTLDPRCVIINLTTAMVRHYESTNYGICSYEQPPLDKLILVMEPLVQTLAREQKSYWKFCQMKKTRKREQKSTVIS